MRKIFKKLVDIDEARRILWDRYRPSPLGVEYVPLTDAGGRVLAEDIIANVDVPSFDRSLRDGYAVRYEDTSTARDDSPVKLRIVDEIEAGSCKTVYIKRGEAVRIATGAPIPGGADSIVMEEYTKAVDGYVYVFKQARPGEWIQHTGSDIMYGEPVLVRGTFLSAREVGVLASIGLNKVPVYIRPRIAIISTGDELISPGESLEYGMIYDVNASSLYNRVLEDGGNPDYLGIARDSPNELAKFLNYGLKNYDVVITSGSTSVGLRDNLFRVLSGLGEPGILFYGVKASPGKPTMAAVIDGKLIIGLPGFPVSCLMMYDSIFSDVIRRLSGLGEREEFVVPAKAGFILRGRLGVRYFHPVFLKRDRDGLKFYPIHAVSGAIAALANSDGYVEIPDNVNYIDVDETVEVNLFSRSIRPSDIVVVTSHSLAFDHLIRQFRSYNPVFNIKTIYSGSMGGVFAIRDGYNDISGMHILDRETGEYNIPFLKSLDIKDVILFRGFSREIGLVVAKGNPLGITSFGDILDKKARFINRTQGSGTRIFIDLNLKALSESRGLSFETILSEIEGYHVEAKTHTSVVASVEVGKADVGVAIRPAVVGRNVDFISLGWENYDFLVNKKSLDVSTPLHSFIEFLSSDEAKKTISSVVGLKVGEDYMDVLLEI